MPVAYPSRVGALQGTHKASSSPDRVGDQSCLHFLRLFPTHVFQVRSYSLKKMPQTQITVNSLQGPILMRIPHRDLPQADMTWRMHYRLLARLLNGALPTPTVRS